MRFGVYLMRRDVITADQLVEALEEQLKRQPPLGQLAIEEGVLTVREVVEVLQLQAKLASTRFGDAAMQLGVLTREQVADLLMQQTDRIPPLTDIVAELGFTNDQTLADELACYRRDMQRSGARRSIDPTTPITRLPPEQAAEFVPSLSP